MLGLMPRKTVASGFFRVQMLIVLGLAVLAVLAAETGGRVASAGADPATHASWLPLARTWTCIALGVGGFLGSVLWTLERRAAAARLLGGLGALSVFALLVSTSMMSAGSTIPGRLDWWSELATAGSLGGAMTAMLLGHSYLTTPTMSLDPLKRLNLYFGIAVIVRAIISAIALAFVWNSLNGSTYWMWLSLRWLAGILGPLVVFVMVQQILRYRNTQAATGVLFVGVILTFIGELTAGLLFQELQVPL